MTHRLPTLFLSHGAPDLVLHELPARHFFDRLAATLPQPETILVASAHYDAAPPRVVAGARPRTIHDFAGFDRRLYDLDYPAAGAPETAARAIELLHRAGFDAQADHAWGIDHGAWIPLLRIYPAATVPVLEISICATADTRYHLALGRALSALRAEGVLIIGSGSLSHNLGALRPPPTNQAAPPWVLSFIDWVAARLAAGDEAGLLEYRAAAPHAAENHPSDEHLMPLFFALGAAGAGWQAAHLHRSFSYGAIAMDAFRFD